jgi:hypothetical protein
MTPEWLEDGRKVPDDVMYYIRRMAVYAVRVLGQSPKKVAEAYNFDRSCIYRWLKQYDGGGFEALESHMPRGSGVPREQDNFARNCGKDGGRPSGDDFQK